MIAPFRLSAAALCLALASSVFAAGDPWDAAPFTSDPKALLAAAAAIPDDDAGVVVLLDEAKHVFDDKGGSASTQRLVYRIGAESAIDEWGSVNAPWAPWYQEKPVIQARVITKDGTVHLLDANAISEAPAPEASLEIFSDNRVIRAPLPAVAVGSVIEQLITYRTKESLYDAASSDIMFFGGFQPVRRARMVIDAPAGLALQIMNNAKIEPRREERDGRQIVTFEGGPYAAKDDIEWDLPYDVAPLPWIGVSTAKSWQELAKRYTDIVEKQIANAGLEKQAREAIAGAKDKRDMIAKSLAWIQKRVRYAGVELGESSVVPRTPQTVLGNRYGDCKDKATLLVALLRQIGIPAHVALLRAGEAFDVPRDLPGLGMFNHAIVFVPDAGDGKPMWVDPTDEFSRAGELPPMDQGRLALIAGTGTKSLTQTPTSESTANRIVETRSFTIPEEGKSNVSELTEPTGADESSMRRYYVSTDRKKYRESMETYAKNYYSAKAMSKLDASDPHDLTKPFQLRIDAAEASRGLAIDGEAAVAINPSGLFENLPWSLRNYDDGKDETKPKKTRKNDFVFSRPFVREWRYRVAAPVGFIPRTLPENATVRVGTLTYTRAFATEADGTVTATLRLDSGKRRLTPAEVEETKKALHELDLDDAIMLGFDQRGQLELTKGNISAALVEFRKLAAAHPKEGRHQAEIARALLMGGMGAAAREQINKAIAVEPKYARAYRTLAVIMQHDLLSRPYRKGFDLKAAIAAYRKAKELDPKDDAIRAELAKLLEYGDEGLMFGHGANLADAITEYKALIGEMEKKEYEPELYLALARSQKWDELREAIKTASNPAQQNQWRVVLAAVTEGAKGAIRDAATTDQAERKDLLRNTAGVLVALRMYGVAADLVEEATQGNPTAETRAQIEGLRKARRTEDLPMPKDDPKSVVRKLMISAILSDMTPEALGELFASDERALLSSDAIQAELRGTRVSLLSVAREQGLPLAFYADVGIGTVQLVQDGSDDVGYRIRTRSSAKGTAEETAFVIREGDGYRISATRKSPPFIGFSVMRLLDAGKNEAARQWLNWTREEFTANGGDDVLASTPFSKYWPKQKQSATVDEMRIAAAMLMPSKDLGEKALAVLTPARAKAQSDEEKLRLDHAIALTYAMRSDFENLAKVAVLLMNEAPDSATAFNLRANALSSLDRNKEVAELANARLQKFPKDDDALRVLGMAAMHAGDYASSEKMYREVVDELRPSAGDYNNIAWNALLSGKNLDRALEDARQAMTLPGAGPALLHTLASLYAETGKSLEAREALLQSMDDAGRDEPAEHDWYVLGRIAENYGATDAAMAAYKRVEKPKTQLASSTYVLAERRVKALAKR